MKLYIENILLELQECSDTDDVERIYKETYFSNEEVQNQKVIQSIEEKIKSENIDLWNKNILKRFIELVEMK